MITGLSHITFIVKKLERSAIFFKKSLERKKYIQAAIKHFHCRKKNFFL